MLISIEHIADDVLLGLWHIDVDESLSPRENECRAVVSLLSEMTCEQVEQIEHTDSGKPLYKDYHISISHTKGYAAVLLSKTHEVGIDIEYVSDRVKRIANRFLRPDEQAESVSDLLIHWCAKETIYKLFSEQDLTFQQMKVTASLGENTSIMVESENTAGIVSRTEVCYRVTKDYVLTFAFA